MNKLFYSLLITVFILGYTSTDSIAQSPEEKGLEIAMEGDKRATGYGDSTSELLMVLKNKHGKESKRRMRMKAFEVEGDGDKSISIFDNPKDVRGTAMLTFGHKDRDDEQWLYLPALKRVKRISSSNKSGSFMGSEFSFEDMGGRELEKYSYKWLRDEPCPTAEFEGQSCFVTVSFPLEKNSGYTRIISWIDKVEYRTAKTEFYDRKNSHLKTLTFSNYKLYLGKYWRALTLEMQNLQTGKSTMLTITSYEFKTGLTDKDFTQASLKRAR
ncbi:MAG: outer membrane lipoprotein-sorting protein [Deltaproteobacteria bacterium]|nr:outer membrane lipoprotein-sorting protein [Deltaproteobacteria bacterium]